MMATEFKDYYKILGVEKSATEKDIKQAYRRLARKHHPDVNPGSKESEEKFKEVSEAYEVLSDEEKRRKYDQFGQYWEQAGRGGGPGFQGPGPGQGGFTFRQGDADFDLNGGFSDFFENLFGGGRSPGGSTRSDPLRRQPGADIQHEIEVTLDEAYRGATRHITMRLPEACSECGGTGDKPGAKPQTCPDCNGTGRTRALGGLISGVCQRCGGSGQTVVERCSRCNGTGAEEKSRRLEFKIPPGVDDGSKIRLQGEGHRGRRGGQNGDLYLIVKMLPHGVYERNGNDLVAEVSVPFTDAALGAEIRVPTLSGGGKIRIPPGTQSGQQFRLSGQGMPSLKGDKPGDEFVRVRITVPRTLTDRQKALLEEFAEISQDKARTAA
jgi:molecular chaperone DnaJ